MRPITEVKMHLLSEPDEARMRGALEGKLHCSMTYMSEGYYLVRFPDGTVEEECSDPDPQYRTETVIRLPGETILRKVVKWPCIYRGCTHTRLLLPGEQEIPRRRKDYDAAGRFMQKLSKGE